MNHKLKFKLIIVILIVILNTNLNWSISKSQSYNYFIYESDFFSLRLNNGTYFGNEDYDFEITIKIFPTDSVENISFLLELTSKETSKIDYSVERIYTYNSSERSIYTDVLKIGMVPLFLQNNLSNNQVVKIAEFSNCSLSGIHLDTDKNLLISGKSYPQHSILTNEVNYTRYYYTDHENLLLYWQIGCQYDVTLDYLFDIGKFYGHIVLEDTNLELRTSENTDIWNFIILIISISVVCIFVVIFLFIRRKLVLNDMRSPKRK